MAWFTDRQCFLLAVVVYGLSMIYSVFLWRKGFRQDNRVNYFLLLLAFGLHTTAMIQRGFRLNHCPVSNLYEATIFAAWTIVAVYLVVGLWSRLQTMSVPKPRYPGGTHIEVDKARQILFDVVDGLLRRIVHVSTGATGNTPLGAFHVYSKVPGFNSELMFDSLFFLRGFAVHGYPSVPPYPASHGCVRTPIWVAPTIYAEHDYGTTIYIY